MYKIILGQQGSADCQLGIENTESNIKVFFDIESYQWNMLGCWWDVKNQKMLEGANEDHCQKILKFIFDTR